MLNLKKKLAFCASLLLIGSIGFAGTFSGQSYSSGYNSQQGERLDKEQKQTFALMERRLNQIEQNHSQYSMSLRREFGHLKEDLARVQQMEAQEDRWDDLDSQQQRGIQTRNQYSARDPRMQDTRGRGPYAETPWDEYDNSQQRGLNTRSQYDVRNPHSVELDYNDPRLKGIQRNVGQSRAMKNPYDDVFN